MSPLTDAYYQSIVNRARWNGREGLESELLIDEDYSIVASSMDRKIID